MEAIVTAAILVAAVSGSVGFVGNGIHTQRHGRDHLVLRRLRNLGVAVVWPPLLARAFL